MKKENFYEKEMNNSGNKKIIGIVIAVIVVVIFAVIIISRKKTGSSAGGMNGFQMNGFGKTATAVRSVVAEDKTLKSFVLTNGEVETQNTIDVYPSMGGKVVIMNVSLGSTVRKGDILGYIDPSEPGSYYANSPIVAPISGSILISPVKVGQKVNVSSVVTRIGDINNLQISAKIPERFVGELKIGQKAEITVQAYPDEIFYASVSKISPVVDTLSRTKEIILNFDKKYEHINAGMFANVKLYTVDYSGYPAIQQDSFVAVDENYYLYVIKEDSTVEKRSVKRGKVVDGMYQVTEGINVGEVVVTEGMLTLYDGAKVNDISGNVTFVENNPAPEGMPEGMPAGGPNGKKGR